MRQRAAYETLAAGGMKALGGVHAYVAGCGLEKTLVDLVYLRVSQINGCAYCIDAHTHDLLKECVSIEQIALLSAWREAGAYFCDRERAALAWAEVVTRVAKTHVPDADYEAAVAVFGEKALADLTIAIGLINTYNRIAISFRTVPESVRPLAS
ncbi:carboxymuconolactone decarboxylase family protein [Phenylobacterium sp.]|uniref:carboxymuconolactone decarboxylase family protein n=1 Tax=Phenylobacterium sp. TaxID=1871053 RepID=UPI0025E7362A|nr:carboxymuconolactone decarboxylase family protein [Phenylobacterium sp.]